LLRLAGGVAITACAPRWTRPSPAIQAVAFDLFTLFDPRGIDRQVASVLEGAPTAFATTWKSRLFESCWLRAAAGRFAPFDRLVLESLAHAARVHGVEVSRAARVQLASAFTALELWPDARDAVRELRARKIRLAPLANFSPGMIEALLAGVDLRASFELQISTAEAQTYKPAPAAYALAERRFALPRHNIAFAAFGGWDASGAGWFGLPTFWVNRFAAGPEELAIPVASGPDLRHLLDWLATSPGAAS
jgi:2-haloacid dehalogenase